MLLSSIITFSIIVIFLFTKAKKLNLGYLALFIMLVSTTLAISVVEYILIKHYGLGPLFTYLTLIINELSYLFKVIVLFKGLSDVKIDYGKLFSKLRMIDPLSLLGLLGVLICR